VVKPQICGCGCGFQVDIQYRKLAVVVLTMIPKTTVLPQPNSGDGEFVMLFVF
jgi:hypothetical protein